MPGQGACGQTFAATLHTREQHTLGNIQIARLAKKGRTAQIQPVLQIFQAADADRALVALQFQQAALIEQLVLHRLRPLQIGVGNGAIIFNGLPQNAARIFAGEADEQAQHLVDHLRIAAYLALAIAAAPQLRFLNQHGAQSRLVGQGHAVVSGIGAQLRRHGQRMADKNKGALNVATALHQILDQAHIQRFIQKWMRVEPDKHAVLR